MATQAWQMPDVDAEKYQSVTKQGGAEVKSPGTFCLLRQACRLHFRAPAAKHASDATFRSSPVCPN